MEHLPPYRSEKGEHSLRFHLGPLLLVLVDLPLAGGPPISLHFLNSDSQHFSHFDAGNWCVRKNQLLSKPKRNNILSQIKKKEIYCHSMFAKKFSHMHLSAGIFPIIPQFSFFRCRGKNGPSYVNLSG